MQNKELPAAPKEIQPILKWWAREMAEVKQAMSGINHRMNLSDGGLRAWIEDVEALRKRCGAFEKKLEERDAIIGSLQADMEKVKEWFRKRKTAESQNGDVS